MGKGKAGSGIEIRETSIRIVFSFQGKQVKETVYLNNDPLSPTPANIKYATRVAAEVKQKIRNDQFVYADYFPHSPRAKTVALPILSDFADTWFAQLHLKHSTVETYRRAINNFWKPHLGHLQIDKIKHSDITTALKKGLWTSGKTRNNQLSIISSVFSLAVSDDIIPKNPCDNIEMAEWQKKKPDPFTMDEAMAILRHMEKEYPEQVANYYQFMFFSGLRTGEGIGLSWREVDLKDKSVLIKQAFVVDEMEDTKTSRERTVHLNTMAMAALTRQKPWTFIENDTNAGRVFLDPGTGKPWAYEQNARKRYWEPTLKRLGIRYRRPYTTRHTYATVGLMAGANPAYMANQLGHGVDVFFKDYSAWISGRDSAREMDKIEAQIRQNSPELTLKNQIGRK